MTTTHVTGVGQVSVLNENNYEMGQEMPNAQGGRGGAEKKQGRQVAGRDFVHEERCLSCWKGPLKFNGKQSKGAKAKAGEGERMLRGQAVGRRCCGPAVYLRTTSGGSPSRSTLS